MRRWQDCRHNIKSNIKLLTINAQLFPYWLQYSRICIGSNSLKIEEQPKAIENLDNLLKSSSNKSGHAGSVWHTFCQNIKKILWKWPTVDSYLPGSRKHDCYWNDQALTNETSYTTLICFWIIQDLSNCWLIFYTLNFSRRDLKHLPSYKTKYMNYIYLALNDGICHLQSLYPHTLRFSFLICNMGVIILLCWVIGKIKWNSMWHRIWHIESTN